MLLSGILIFGTYGSAQVNPQNAGSPQLINSNTQQQKKDSREKLAVDYYRNRNFQQAAELFEQLYKEQNKNYYYSYYYNCLIELQDYKKAEKLAKQEKRNNQTSYRYTIDEAYAADLQGNKKKADKILNSLIEDLPSDKNRVIQLASMLQSRKYTNYALEVLQAAKINNENDYSYDMEMANAYLYAGEYDKMFDSYLNHLLNVPTDVQRVKIRLQNVMRMDVNSNLSEILKMKLLFYAQSNPENEVMAEMLLWYSMQTQDFEMAYRQAVAIDRRFGDDYEIMMELAKISFSNYNYNISSDAYNYIAQKGNTTPYYMEAKTGAFVSNVILLEENPESTIKDYRNLEKEGIQIVNELGVNQITSEIILNVAHISAVKLNKFDEAISMLNTALEQMQKRPASQNSPIANKQEAVLKLELADILLITGKVWDASLLYSQVESSMKNEPVGYEAKFRNAKIFYYSGEFDWANTKLDVLKSSTSKLISNDAIELSMFISNMQEEDTLGFNLRAFAGADLYSYQGKYDSALRLLNEIQKYPSGAFSIESVLYRQGDLFSLMYEYDKADSAYAELVANFPSSVKADNALYKQAEIYRTYYKNNDKAKELYLRVMTEYPESIYAGKSRKRYRNISD